MSQLTRRRFLTTFGLSGAGAMTLGSSYGFALEPRCLLKVTRYQVSPRRWTKGLRLSIAVIADLHAGAWVMPADRVRAICEHTNTLGADLIVLLGDFVASEHLRTHDVEPEEWSEPLRILKAPLGVHAILGNHDWWDDEDAQAAGKGPVVNRRALEGIGFPVYENDAIRLAKDGQPFWLAGLADQLALELPEVPGQRPRYQGLDDLSGTLAQVKDEAPIILLAHEPDIFPRVPDRVSLTLCGHTHGGQVRLFGYSPWVPSRYGNRYAYGHVIEKNRHLIVSGGLGCSILPVRIGVPPEIVLVDVVA